MEAMFDPTSDKSEVFAQLELGGFDSLSFVGTKGSDIDAFAQEGRRGADSAQAMAHEQLQLFQKRIRAIRTKLQNSPGVRRDAMLEQLALVQQAIVEAFGESLEPVEGTADPSNDQF